IDDDWLYNQFMLYSLHGQSKDALSKSKAGSWEYDIIYPAYKCNMTDIMASIGLVQIDRYKSLLSSRRDIIEFYDKELSSLNLQKLQHYGDEFNSSGHLYLIRIPNINE